MPPAISWRGHKKKKKKLLQNQQANFSQTNGTNHPWVKGIINCSNKGPGSLQKEDNHKWKTLANSLKTFFLENH
jgi:hypothetical protein